MRSAHAVGFAYAEGVWSVVDGMWRERCHDDPAPWYALVRTRTGTARISTAQPVSWWHDRAISEWVSSVREHAERAGVVVRRIPSAVMCSAGMGDDVTLAVRRERLGRAELSAPDPGRFAVTRAARLVSAGRLTLGSRWSPGGGGWRDRALNVFRRSDMTPVLASALAAWSPDDPEADTLVSAVCGVLSVLPSRERLRAVRVMEPAGRPFPFPYGASQGREEGSTDWDGRRSDTGEPIAAYVTRYLRRAHGEAAGCSRCDSGTCPRNRAT